MHIEDLQSNANNFVVTELSHDPIIRNIFNMIEKNIVDTDSNAITVNAPTDDDNVTELCMEPTMKNEGSNPKNITAYFQDMETYDNLNLPSCAIDEKQSVQKRNNLKLNLKSSRKITDDKKCQSIPHPLISNFEEKDNHSGTKSFLMLPRHMKLTPISSSNSTEITSPVTPLTPASISFHYPDLKKQEAAYDALVSRKIISPLYVNQEVTTVNLNATDTNSFEAKLNDFKDQMEIQQALKQLDDALDEQIFIETFQTLNSKKFNTEAFEEKTESTKSNDNKKSVKQLVEMLDSKQLQFRKWNMPSKLHPIVINQDSDFISDKEGNTEAKASLDVSDPETSSKPSLIGVNIFGLDGGKSIAEIIAEKRNHKNRSLHKRPPTSPKPVLKIPFPNPKPSISDEEEQNWLLPSSSSNEAVHPSEKSIFDDGKENIIITVDKKPKIQAKHQKISNSEMLPTIIKVVDSESSINFRPTMTDTTSSVTTTDAIEKDSNQQYLRVDHIYENLNQNGSEKYLETSFNGPIAMTVISDSKNGATKNLAYTCDNLISGRKVRMINFYHI